MDSIEQRKAGLVDGDIDRRMKDESILRATLCSRCYGCKFMDPQREVSCLNPVGF